MSQTPLVPMPVPVPFDARGLIAAITGLVDLFKEDPAYSYRSLARTIDEQLAQLRLLPDPSKVVARLAQDAVVARDHYDRGEFSEALEAAKAVKKALKKALAEGRKAQQAKWKEDKLDAKRKAQVATFKEQVEAHLRALEGMVLPPSLEERRKGLEKAVTEALAKTVSGQWKVAKDDLERLVEQGKALVKDAREWPQKALAKHDTSTQNISTTYGNVLKLIEDNRHVLHPDDVRRYKARATWQLGVLDGLGGKEEEEKRSARAKVFRALVDLHGDIWAFDAALKRPVRERVAAGLEEALERVKTLSSIAPEAQLLEAHRLTGDVATLLALPDIDRADTAMGELKNELVRLAPLEKDHEDLEALWAGDAKDLLTDLQALGEAAAAGLRFDTPPRVWIARSAVLRRVPDPSIATTCAAAVGEIGALLVDVVAAKKRLQDWTALADARDRKDVTVQAAAKSLREGPFATLAEKMREAGIGKPPTLGGLQLELDEALHRWDELKGEAIAAEALDEAPTLDTIAAIRRRTEAAVGDEGADALAELIGNEQLAVQRGHLDGAAKRVTELLQRYALFGRDDSEAKRTDWTRTLGEAEDAYARLATMKSKDLKELAAKVAAAVSFGDELQIAIGAVEDEHARRRKALEHQRDAIAANLAALEKVAAKSTRSKDLKKVREQVAGEVHTRLTQQLQLLWAIVTEASSETALDRADVRIGLLDKEVSQWIAACGDPEAPVPVGPESLADRLGQVRRVLKDDEKACKRFRPSQLAKVKLEIGAVEGRLGDVREDLGRIANDIDAVGKKVLALLDRVWTDQGEYDRFLPRLERAKKQRDKLTEGTKATLSELKAQREALIARVEGLYDRAVALSKSEGGLVEAGGVLAELEDLATRHRDAEDKLKLLSAEAEVALEAVRRREQEKAAYETVHDKFDKNWVEPIKHEQAKEMIKDLRRSAEALAKAEDYRGALETLRMAIRRAIELRQLPGEAESATTLKNLGTAAAGWRTAVEETWLGEIRGFRTYFGTRYAAKEKARKAVHAALDELSNLFGPAAFDPFVERIRAHETVAQERLQQREHALALVRRYERTLREEARIRLLRHHPLDGAPGFAAPLALHAALVELERLLLMAVPLS